VVRLFFDLGERDRLCSALPVTERHTGKRMTASGMLISDLTEWKRVFGSKSEGSIFTSRGRRNRGGGSGRKEKIKVSARPASL